MSTFKIIKEFKLGESFEQPLTFLMMAIVTETVLIVLEIFNNLVYQVDGTQFKFVSIITTAWRIGA